MPPGFIVNHFTISINDCDTFENLEQVNSFLKENGYRVNDSQEEEIKGLVEQGLEQSSIMAENVLVEFDALEYKPVEIPVDAIMNCTLRHNDFDGFIVKALPTKFLKVRIISNGKFSKNEININSRMLKYRF